MDGKVSSSTDSGSTFSAIMSSINNSFTGRSTGGGRAPSRAPSPDLLAGDESTESEADIDDDKVHEGDDLETTSSKAASTLVQLSQQDLETAATGGEKKSTTFNSKVDVHTIPNREQQKEAERKAVLQENISRREHRAIAREKKKDWITTDVASLSSVAESTAKSDSQQEQEKNLSKDVREDKLDHDSKNKAAGEAPLTPAIPTAVDDTKNSDASQDHVIEVGASDGGNTFASDGGNAFAPPVDVPPIPKTIEATKIQVDDDDAAGNTAAEEGEKSRTTREELLEKRKTAQQKLDEAKDNLKQLAVPTAGPVTDGPNVPPRAADAENDLKNVVSPQVATLGGLHEVQVDLGLKVEDGVAFTNPPVELFNWKVSPKDRQLIGDLEDNTSVSFTPLPGWQPFPDEVVVASEGVSYVLKNMFGTKRTQVKRKVGSYAQSVKQIKDAEVRKQAAALVKQTAKMQKMKIYETAPTHDPTCNYFLIGYDEIVQRPDKTKGGLRRDYPHYSVLAPDTFSEKANKAELGRRLVELGQALQGTGSKKRPFTHLCTEDAAEFLESFYGNQEKKRK